VTSVRLWRGSGVRWAPYAVLAAVAGAAGYVAAVDPDRPGHYPTCPFYALSGYYCPGCGTLRMVHALTHGHVAEAFGRNALAFLTIPALVYLWVRWALAARRGRPLPATLLSPWAVIAFAVVSVVFWVVRNVPAGHALAP
jgi:uncharacterized protein DUF2752